MDIGDKVRTLYERKAFVTVKDHKEAVRSCLPFRLINITKTELRVISCVIIKNVCDLLGVTTQVNQW